MDEKLSKAEEIVLEAMPKGRENAVFASEIGALCGFSPREIRAAVNSLRKKGKPICALHDVGYWLTDDPEEIKWTINQLMAHAESLEQTAEKLKKVLEGEKTE